MGRFWSEQTIGLTNPPRPWPQRPDDRLAQDRSRERSAALQRLRGIPCHCLLDGDALAHPEIVRMRHPERERNGLPISHGRGASASDSHRPWASVGGRDLFSCADQRPGQHPPPPHGPALLVHNASTDQGPRSRPTTGLAATLLFQRPPWEHAPPAATTTVTDEIKPVASSMESDRPHRSGPKPGVSMPSPDMNPDRGSRQWLVVLGTRTSRRTVRS